MNSKGDKPRPVDLNRERIGFIMKGGANESLRSGNKEYVEF